MSLEPPEKLRSLQGKLYDKAKAEPGYRFYLLYDKIHRPDVLTHAYALVRQRRGAWGGRGDVRSDRGGGSGALAGWLGGGASDEALSSPACAKGADPEAWRRRASARHPDDSGPG